MARHFEGGSNQSLTYTPFAIAEPFSLACRFYSLNTNPSAFYPLISVGDKDTPDDQHRLQVADVVDASSFDGTLSFARSTAAHGGDGWYHAAGVWAASNNRAAYLNGGNKGTNTTARAVQNIDLAAISQTADSTPLYGTLSITEAAIWNVALTGDEVAVLATGISPLLVRPESLVCYLPLIRDDDEDIVGGLSFTANGSPTIAAHPRVFYPGAVLVGVPAAAGPTTYYVDATTGDDDDSGLTEELAWQTIAKVNGETFDPGDSILFKRGETWTGTRLVVPSSGTSGSPIRFGVYGSGALPVLQGDANGCFRIADRAYITAEDLDASGVNTGGTVAAIQVHDSSHISIDGAIARDATGAGIFIEEVDVPGAAHDITVENCVAHDNGTIGIVAQDLNENGVDSVSILDNVVYNNGTDENAHHGIYLRECYDSLIRGNESYGNACGGIKINTCLTTVVEKNDAHDNVNGIIDDGERVITGGNTIRNNLAYGNTNNGLELKSDINGDYWYHNTSVNNGGYSLHVTAGTNTGHVFKNNILLQDANVVGAFGYYCVCLALVAFLDNNTFDHNCEIYIDTGNGDTNRAVDDASYTWAEWQGLGAAPDPNSINVNPVFVTPGTDFHLQVTSPCRGAGVDVGVTDDYDGVARGDPPDIGAYEYVAGGVNYPVSLTLIRIATASPSASAAALAGATLARMAAVSEGGIGAALASAILARQAALVDAATAAALAAASLERQGSLTDVATAAALGSTSLARQASLIDAAIAAALASATLAKQAGLTDEAVATAAAALSLARQDDLTDVAIAAALGSSTLTRQTAISQGAQATAGANTILARQGGLTDMALAAALGSISLLRQAGLTDEGLATALAILSLAREGDLTDSAIAAAMASTTLMRQGTIAEGGTAAASADLTISLVRAMVLAAVGPGNYDVALSLARIATVNSSAAAAALANMALARQAGLSDGAIAAAAAVMSLARQGGLTDAAVAAALGSSTLARQAGMAQGAQAAASAATTLARESAIAEGGAADAGASLTASIVKAAVLAATAAALGDLELAHDRAISESAIAAAAASFTAAIYHTLSITTGLAVNLMLARTNASIMAATAAANANAVLAQVLELSLGATAVASGSVNLSRVLEAAASALAAATATISVARSLGIAQEGTAAEAAAVIALTLMSRDLDLTLEERSLALSLVSRALALTLQERS